jgi:hypothetical protein
MGFMSFKARIGMAATCVALAVPVAAAGPAAAGQDGLVNVYAKDLLNGNQVTLLQNVSVPIAAAVCGVDVNVLSAQLDKGDANCPAKSNAFQFAWVSRH